MKRFIAVFLLFALLILSLPACAAKSGKRYSDTCICFDTACSFYMGAASDEEFAPARDEVFALLQRLHGLFDVYGDYDEPNLKSVNDAAGRSPVKVDEEILELLSFSLSISEKTNGAFDPVMGAVTGLWKEATEEKKPPEEEALAEAGRHIGARFLEIDRDAGTVCLTDPGAKLDVGAVAKGYAARKVRELLKEKHIENWLLALGGSIVSSGVDPEKGKPWQVGVRDPFDTRGVYAEYILKDTSIATGGSYERYFEYDGKRFHHIIAPSTCRPAESGLVSVSVFCDDPALADALTTAFFVAGEEESAKAAEQLGVSVLFIRADGSDAALGELPEGAERSGVSTGDLVVYIFLGVLLLSVLVLLFLRRKKETSEANDEKSAFPAFGRKDAILLSVLAVLILGFCLLYPRLRQTPTDSCVVVRVNGRETAVLSLSEDRSYEVNTDKGRNLIVVRGGQVYIAEADCPGQDCVHAGAIDASSVPGALACLPHGLTVTVEEGREG